MLSIPSKAVSAARSVFGRRLQPRSDAPYLVECGGITGSILSQSYTLRNPDLGPNTTVANINLGTSPNIEVTDYGTNSSQRRRALYGRKAPACPLMAEFRISRSFATHPDCWG